MSPEIHSHLSYLSHKAAHNVVNFPHDHLEPKMDAHEFVSKDHHEVIIKTLELLHQKNPRVAEQFKHELIAVCNIVLSREGLTDFHSSAKTLQQLVSVTHARLVETMPWEESLSEFLEGEGEDFESVRFAILRNSLDSCNAVMEQIRIEVLQSDPFADIISRAANDNTDPVNEKIPVFQRESF